MKISHPQYHRRSFSDGGKYLAPGAAIFHAQADG